MKHNRKISLLTSIGLAVNLVAAAVPQQYVFAAGTDLYVGYAGKNGSFNTVQDAVDAAAQYHPQSEFDRVTIHIAPGTYREQVTVTTPYITFVNDSPNESVLLTWYYGIGYKYYSVSQEGVYSKEAAQARNAKNEPKTRWGCSVRLRSNASYFRAENISFENSFNRYITDEELADGVEVSGSQSISFYRTKGADVRQKAATERAAAIAVEANYSEFKNCRFMSSQDTLYLGSEYGYFQDCLVEGNTDYIFGSGTYVFDSCELRFKGYSGSAAGGYITANKNAGRTLFTNCRVTAASDLVVSPGYFGRPWGDSPDVAFVNTKLQYEGIITGAGWTKMSNNAPENAKFKEYGTTANGAPVNTGSRVKGTVRYSADGLDTKTYLGSWTPFFLGGESAVTIPTVSGILVQELQPYHGGYAWKIQEDAQQSSKIYTDRDFVFQSLPDALAGGELIQTPCDAKKLSGTVAVFTANKDMTLSVLLDNRVEKVPSWMTDYQKTELHAESNNDVTFDVYQAEFQAGDSVVLGANEQSAYCMNYAVIVQEKKVGPTLSGDTDCSGTLNAVDLTIMKQMILGIGTPSDISLANGDYNQDGTIDTQDAALLLAFLKNT
ncbi:MAG: pectinesterase family protein [Oscillospiraceae bacterium]|nr:pectinesterase family protein [Oscillospiraceae bacterium]